MYGVLADLLVVVHLAFVFFVVCGGFLVWRWPRLVWVHIPSTLWGIGIELWGCICPLTPWENWLRGQAGQVGYEGDFIEHYLMPILYPTELTRSSQILLAGVAFVVNLVAYGTWWYRYRSVAVRRAR